MIKIIQTLIIGFILVASTSIVFGISHRDRDSALQDDELDDFIIQKMQQRHIPGLSASIVRDGTVKWQGAYGFADFEQNVSVTNNTLFKIASVSKTITATALMQLFEQGYFNLSDPINTYLPYHVVHPMYPSTNITFHMLLTHSSGICDNWQYLFHFVGDAPIPFQTFLEEYLIPWGQYYDSENNFYSWEPGTSCQYSNIAVALVGYLVEVISGMYFSDYVDSHVFTPMEMSESAWFLRDLNISHIAMPYHWEGNKYIPYGHIGYVDVPAGDLRTSSSQLINFLKMYINNGSYNNRIILNDSTIQLMLTPQLPFQPNIGLIWWKSTIGGRMVWGHNGADFGGRAMMHFDPITRIGVVVLSNGEADIMDISNALFTYGETLVNSPPDTPMRASGQLQGTIQMEYRYTSQTYDPEDNQIYYLWDWGDGMFSGWLGPFSSGDECSASHTWTEQGNYEIKVKAKDSNGAESTWSDPTPIIMPRNSYLAPMVFPKLFHRFFQDIFYFISSLKIILECSYEKIILF